MLFCGDALEAMKYSPEVPACLPRWCWRADGLHKYVVRNHVLVEFNSASGAHQLLFAISVARRGVAGTHMHSCNSSLKMTSEIAIKELEGVAITWD